MSSKKFFRYTTDDMGIYEAVEKYCPRDDQRRNQKPDGAWLPKVGKDFPGAVSFFTEKGFHEYWMSGLRDWHFSVVPNRGKMLIVERPEKVLYEDEYQIIISPEDVPKGRSYEFEYEGPKPGKDRVHHHSPPEVVNLENLIDYNAYTAYTGSDETFAHTASYADKGLINLGIHYEVLKPGKRSSWPHAHKVEEELVYILEGEADVWVNGKTHKAKPHDVIFFEPNTNLAHTIENNSKEDLVMLVIGEQNAKEDKIFYPENEKRNDECREQGFFWDDRPEPPEFKTLKNINEIEQKVAGGPDEPLHYYVKNRDLGRSLGAKTLAMHHMVIMPGYRCGIPHAESLEEEFIFVLKGKPYAWLNGHRYPLQEKEAVVLPPGTGVLHTIINDSEEEVEVLVIGETWKDENKMYYGINPELRETHKDIWWDDHPPQELGDDPAI